MGQQSDQFWRLVELEHNKALAYCGRLAERADDGDDLYQDSLIKAFHGFESLRNTESFRPWLYRIINNTYKARFRSSWWKKLTLHRRDIEAADRLTDPTGLYEAKRRLDLALEVLSPDDRILVTLAELEDWTIAELAGLMSKSDGFVKMRLSRARAKMRQKLSRLYKDQLHQTAILEEPHVYVVPPDTTETQ
jgi:RNA polymerase sigma factor (sigma-70 family)